MNGKIEKHARYVACFQAGEKIKMSPLTSKPVSRHVRPAHTHTHTGPDTHRLISSLELDTSFICKTPGAPSPLVNMSCSSGGRWVTRRSTPPPPPHTHTHPTPLPPTSLHSDIRLSSRRGQQERRTPEWLSEGRLVLGWRGSLDLSSGSSAWEVELNRSYWRGEWHWRLNSRSSGFYIIFPLYSRLPGCGCVAQIKTRFVN